MPKKVNFAPRPRKLSTGPPFSMVFWRTYRIYKDTAKLGKSEIAGGSRGVRVKLAAGEERSRGVSVRAVGIDNNYPAEVVNNK